MHITGNLEHIPKLLEQRFRGRDTPEEEMKQGMWLDMKPMLEGEGLKGGLPTWASSTWLNRGSVEVVLHQFMFFQCL